MKRFRLLSVAVVALTLSAIAAAATHGSGPELGDMRLALIDDPLCVEFSGDPAKLTPPNMQRAIAVAAASKDWRVTNESSEKMELMTIVNGKHTVRVEVRYSATSYEIRYLESANLLYAEKKTEHDKLKVIHKNYNAWIRELSKAIEVNVGVNGKLSVAGVPEPLPGPSNFADVKDVNAVPYLSKKGKESYKKFLAQNGNRAFAISPNGNYAWTTLEPRARLAVQRCNNGGGEGKCKLYAVDGAVVWQKE